MKKVSIIVPAYNAETYIHECLNSLISIDYPEKEIIVVDDGSTDLTGLICDEYASKYNNIIACHKKNGGVSSARNLGLDNAQGDYIFFVDSDDTVEKDYIKSLCINEDEDFVQGGCRVLENDFLKEIMNIEDVLSDYAKYWFESPCTFVWQNCYKKELIDKHQIRFDESVKIGEDARFNNKYIVTCKKIRRTPLSSYNHNRVATSAVHKLYMNRLQIEKEECMQIECYAKNRQSMMRLRWYHWHIVLQHYQIHIQKDVMGKRDIEKKMKEAYKDSYFRETLAYIRHNGTLDEKMESFFMGYVKHVFFKPTMKMIRMVYNFKQLIYHKK